MKQQLPGQHEPPPQQSFSVVAIGVAAVSPMNAANMSKYFITPPFEFSFQTRLHCLRRAVGEEELNARGRDRWTIGSRFANAVLGKKASFSEQRDARFFDYSANKDQRGTGRRTAL